MSIATDELYSTLGSDPDLGPMVDLYVDEMPERINTMIRCLETGDWQGLRRAAHYLRGAGCYGFDTITPEASRLVAVLHDESDQAAIRRSVHRLVDLCSRIRGGSGDGF